MVIQVDGDKMVVMVDLVVELEEVLHHLVQNQLIAEMEDQMEAMDIIGMQEENLQQQQEMDKEQQPKLLVIHLEHYMLAAVLVLTIIMDILLLEVQVVVEILILLDLLIQVEVVEVVYGWEIHYLEAQVSSLSAGVINSPI